VLKDLTNEDYYKCLMCFFVILRVFATPKFYSTDIQKYAYALCDTFYDQLITLFGESFMSYNSHSLIHLRDDVKRLGSVDTFSCFKFENFMKFIKRAVHTPNEPLKQVTNQLLESSQCLG
jgi:hypothetical protein